MQLLTVSVLERFVKIIHLWTGQNLDIIDNKIIELLKRRYELVIKILKIKKEKGLPIYDPKREGEVIKKWKEKGKKLNIPEEIIEEIAKSIVKSFREYQLKLFKHI